VVEPPCPRDGVSCFNYRLALDGRAKGSFSAASQIQADNGSFLSYLSCFESVTHVIGRQIPNPGGGRWMTWL
jgi:hypothetical protein